MGGGGSYYDRDVTDRSLRTTRGFSSVAEEKLSRREADKALLPFNRRVKCESKSPIVFAFDVTGSMGTLPRIIYDKMPMIVGQIIERGYLNDPAISVAAIGDVEGSYVGDRGDDAPIQIGDFTMMRNLDEWLGKIWLEGGGGGQAKESYELTLYFYARNCDLTNAETPFFIITGDEGFRENLRATELNKRFGGTHESTNSQTIFDELKVKFKGNVFLVHRYYTNTNDQEIVDQWQKALGKDNVIQLGSDLAIADTILGLIAITTGSRTLDEYLEDMKNREQTADRITEVRKSLRSLTANLDVAPKTKAQKTAKKPSAKEGKPTAAKPKTKKPGRF